MTAIAGAEISPILAGAAEEIELDEDRTITFTDPRRIVMVMSGAVDLFAVEVADDGARGRWTFLNRLERGAILPGTPSGPRHQVIGRPVLGSVIAQLVVDKLLDLSGERAEQRRHDAEHREAVDQFVAGVEQGIAAVSQALRTSPRPREFVALQRSAELEVVDGDVACSVDGVLWVDVVSGAVHLGDGIGGRVSAGDELCVTEQDWLIADGPTQLRTRTTRELLAKEALWRHLVKAVGRSIYEVDRRVERRRRHECETLERRREYNVAATTEAAEVFNTVLHETDTRTRLVDVAGDPPALAAARLVAGYGQFHVRAPVAGSGHVRAATDIQAIAMASNVRIRSVRLEGPWWRHDQGALIGVRKVGSVPVALLPAGRGYVMIADGKATRVDHKVAAQLRNTATVLYRPLPDTVRGIGALMRFGLRNNGRDMWRFAVIAVLVAALGLLVPIMTGVVLGSYVPHAQRSLIVEGSLVVVASAFVIAALSVVQNIAALRIESRTSQAMQVAVWTKLLSLPASFFSRYSAGELGTKVLGVSSAQELLTGMTTTAALGLLAGLANLVLVFFLNVWLALLALGLLAVGTTVALVAGRTEVRWQRRLYDYEQGMSSLVFQILSAVPKLRVAAAEERVFRRWAGEFARGRRLSASARRAQNAVTTFNAGFPVAASAIIFAVVAGPMHSDIAIGTFLSFFSAFNLLLAASLQFTATIVTALGVVPMLQELQPILDADPEIGAAQADPGELYGQVALSHVSYRYSPDAPLVLDDVSLTIEPGEFVALVGPSGSGKSTVLRLLLGFETPTFGTVLYDGQALAELDVSALRRQCGAVLQKGALLAASIKTNIIGSGNFTMDDAWAAAEMAGIADDIKALPMGMNTVLSEGTSTFSGGQRQRLMIARALVSRPRILLLDEATSALDNPTQHIVAEATRKLNASRLVIAHRLSTIVDADRIVVLDRGRVVQQGRYDDLMSDEDGLFAVLARRQM